MDTSLTHFHQFLKVNNLSQHQILHLIQDDICASVKLYTAMTFLSHEERFIMIMNDYKNTPTDFTLKTHHQLIPCHKKILMQIPYYQLLFEDCECPTELELKFSATAVQSLVDSLYFNRLHISFDFLYDLLCMMDMFMYYPDINHVVKYLQKNIANLLKLYLQDVSKITMIETILYNMTCSESISDKHKESIREILGRDFKICFEHLFSFERWPDRFDAQQQKEAILKSGQYELLNKSSLNVKEAIDLLLEQFHDDCLYPIMNQFKFDNPGVYYGNILLDTTLKSMISIDQYYPLKYSFVRPLYADGQIQDTQLILTLSSKLKSPIGIGSKLIISQYNVYATEQNTYTIESIVKCVMSSQTKQNVSQLSYLHQGGIRYIITLDKEPILAEEWYIWHIEEMNIK